MKKNLLCLQGGFSMFIQLMPVVVLILVSLLSQMMVSPPPYSLYSRPYVNESACCSLSSVILIQHMETMAAVTSLLSIVLQVYRPDCQTAD